MLQTANTRSQTSSSAELPATMLGGTFAKKVYNMCSVLHATFLPIRFRTGRRKHQGSSLNIWDQRLVHGSAPKMREERRSALRAAIPIRLFKKDSLRRERESAKSRASVLKREIDKCGVTCLVLTWHRTRSQTLNGPQNGRTRAC